MKKSPLNLATELIGDLEKKLSRVGTRCDGMRHEYGKEVSVDNLSKRLS